MAISTQKGMRGDSVLIPVIGSDILLISSSSLMFLCPCCTQQPETHAQRFHHVFFLKRCFQEHRMCASKALIVQTKAVRISLSNTSWGKSGIPEESTAVREFKGRVTTVCITRTGEGNSSDNSIFHIQPYSHKYTMYYSGGNQQVRVTCDNEKIIAEA